MDSTLCSTWIPDLNFTWVFAIPKQKAIMGDSTMTVEL